MATIKSTLSLEDNMSKTFSKVQKSAIQNITTFNKLQKEIDSLTKSLNEAEKINPNIVSTDAYLNASSAIDTLKDKQYQLAQGNIEVADSSDNVNISMTDLNQGLEILSKGWNLVTSAMQEANEWMELSNNQFNQEFGSAVKMHNVLGASKEEIQSMYDYASALQQVGVVGDEAVLAGVSELSVYADSYDEVKKLIPSVLDLAVAENELNTSQSDIESTASSVGKALNGSATMLTRQGILTEAQADKLDKLNTKTEKAAYLSEILTDKFGGTNEALANSPRGGIMQADNALGDLGETLGDKIIPYFSSFKQLVVEILTPIAEFASTNSNVIIPTLIAVAAGIAVLTIALIAYKAIVTLTSIEEWSMIAPLLIIIGMIAAFVLAINLAAEWISNWSGESVSALGMVSGAFMVVVTGIENLLIDAYNLCMTIADGIALIFIGLAEIILGVIDEIAEAIDFVFGSNLQEGTTGLINKLADTGESIIQDPGYLDRKSYTDAYNSGYDWGANKSEQFKSGTDDIFSILDDVMGTDATGGNAIQTTTKDNLLSDDDIQLLLDVATRDYQLNYQQVTPNITVSFGDVRETADVDSVLEAVGTRVEEIINGDGEVGM